MPRVNDEGFHFSNFLSIDVLREIRRKVMRKNAEQIAASVFGMFGFPVDWFV